MLGDLSVWVEFGGEIKKGSRSTLWHERVQADEGLRNRYQFSVTLIKAEWFALPTGNDVVTIEDTAYRVLATEEGPAKRSVRLDLGLKYST